MGERNLYEYWADTYKVHNMDWTLATAKAILDDWQLKFTQVSTFWGLFFNVSCKRYAQAWLTQNWLKAEGV